MQEYTAHIPLAMRVMISFITHQAASVKLTVHLWEDESEKRQVTSFYENSFDHIDTLKEY